MRQSTVALLVFKLYSTPEHMFLNTGKRSVPGVQIVFFHMYSVHATTVATFPQKHNKVGESLSQCTYESAPLPPPSRPLSPSSLLERRALRARKSFLFSPPSLYFLPTPLSLLPPPLLPPPLLPPPVPSSPSSLPLFSPSRPSSPHPLTLCAPSGMSYSIPRPTSMLGQDPSLEWNALGIVCTRLQIG